MPVFAIVRPTRTSRPVFLTLLHPDIFAVILELKFRPTSIYPAFERITLTDLKSNLSGTYFVTGDWNVDLTSFYIHTTLFKTSEPYTSGDGGGAYMHEL